MTDLVKVEGYAELVRDINTKAVINTDKDALLKAKKAKADKLKERERINKLERDVTEIKDTLELILNLLKKDN